MNKTKKKISNKKFIAIWAPFLSLSALLAIGIESFRPMYGGILDTYIGRGEVIKTPAKGTEEWDAKYYGQSFETGEGTATGGAAGSAKANANAEKVVEEITDEGMILLKNKNNSLPIATTTGITLLGRGSVDPIYGGSGSGNVDASKAITPIKGLQNAGFTVNQDAYDFFNNNYKNYDRQAIKMDDYQGSTFFIGEIPTSKYTFTPAKNDVAVVFISRCGGEGLDLSTDLKRDINTTASKNKIATNPNTAAEVANYVNGQHELELSKEEKDMISFAKANYQKTIIVLNESTTMEIGDLKNDDDIDGIIWAGSPGSTGFNSLGKIIYGAINPSGRTNDLYSADFTLDPTFQNFAINGVNEYKNVGDIDLGNGNAKTAHFTTYEEGVYVGYKYYETADYEAKAGNYAGFNYDSAVVYPFGYGLSYTSFDKEIVSSSTFGDNVEITVKVTNTGTTAGKEVVQAYYSAPYTKGSIEKPSTVLGDFAKTKLLKSGESDTVKITIAKDDMASYDYNDKNNNGFKGYELEAGEYKVQIKDDSHTVATHAGKALEVSFTQKEEKLIKKDSDKTDVTNKFDDVSAYFKDTKTDGYGLAMSRSSFTNTFPTKATEKDADASKIKIGDKTIADLLKPYSLEGKNNEDDVMPTMNESNGLSTIDLRGLDYDDKAYELLLNQLTADDYAKMSAYLNASAYNTAAIESLGKPKTEDHDGPQGFSQLWGGLPNVTAFMSEPLLASTFNKDLAKKMGVAIGEEALAMSTRFSGWYGPAMNTHRSPFAGRNFEYYSEDGVLGGKIAAQVVAGAADKGLYAYIKHFALNDQETWRTTALCTWADEQTIREIYLKPFEICVKEAKTTIKYIDDSEGTIKTKEMNATTGVMSSFNRIGTTWAGGNKGLMTDVLRNEWGFRGMAISDFNLYGYMNPDQGMRAGTDLQLSFPNAKNFADTESATARIALRNAMHNVLYTVTNSNAMQDVKPGTIISYKMSPWRIYTIIADVALFGFTIIGTAWVVIRVRKNKNIQ